MFSFVARRFAASMLAQPGLSHTRSTIESYLDISSSNFDHFLRLFACVFLLV